MFKLSSLFRTFNFKKLMSINYRCCSRYSKEFEMESNQQTGIINHCKILQLLTRGNEQLHRIFRERWSTYHTLKSAVIEWNDDEASGIELVKLSTSGIPKIKDLLQNGKVDLWDITSTNSAIQAVSKEIRKLGSKIDKKEDKNINALKDIRNDVMHGKSELSDDEFTRYWDQLIKILVELGVDASAFEDVKNLKIGQNDSLIKPEFKKLKDEANKLFKLEQFKEAVEVYNQILEIPGLLPEDQALIFSNRSATYLLLKNYTMAGRDAEWAIQLWPCWWKGYYRLGRTQAALGKWLEAENSLKTALALDSNKEVFHELSIVRTKIGITSRQEHLNPAQQPKSLEENLEEVRSRLGLSENQTKKFMNMAKNDPIFGNIIRGHSYRDGIGVEQDYAKAASYYGKAAAAGEAEAMYNLGRLYHHGYGVPVDYNQSMYWLKKAAEAKPFGGIRIGSGVPEAQHMLGLKYSEGTGVKKDFRIAAEWYKKAISNGFGASANNLGLQYKNGQGVEKSSQKAFEYFKLASKRDDTAAMQNLADCYFAADGTGSVYPTDEDIKEGMKWLRIAAGKGDLLAAQELERREKLNSHETLLEGFKNLIFPGMTATSDPLDQEQYGKLVQEAAKKGSVTAQRHLNIWKNLNIAMNAFKNRDHKALVAALAKAIKLDHQVVEIPKIFHGIITDRMKSNPKDLDTIVCNVRLNSKNPKLPEMLVDYLKIFPNDAYLLEYLIITFISNGQIEKALSSINKVLQIYPKSSRLLYCRAIALCMSDELKPESITALDAFLAVAPGDHDKVPACYYRKAFYYLATNQKKFMESYEAGLAAEKKQLPCFLPYFFPKKDLLERAYLAEKKMQGGKKKVDDTSENPVNNNLQQILANVHRKLLTDKHRQTFISLLKEKTYDKKNLMFETTSNLPNAPKPPRLISLKEITLKEMDPTTDKVYDGYVLEARILEWSYLMTGIATIIEDKNGDVERLCVYNWPSKGNVKQKFIDDLKTFRPNCMVSIINPYMRMAKDMQSLIRVESPEFIRLDPSSADKKCFCCGKEAKVLPCSQCMMARYCSKECQKADWVNFDHKSICKYLKPFSNLV